ncbi:MAG: hypothetical protein GX163_07045 [Bacteroidetes bacterium]|jgi:hypothetical protein|nr:hypothetical protein [Bacteroidota bacterium]
MKSTYLILCCLISAVATAQQPSKFEGAYKFIDDETHGLWLFTDGYASQTFYKNDAYIGVSGGTYRLDKKTLEIQMLFNDTDAEKIGSKQRHILNFEGENFIDDEGRIWIKQPEIKNDLVGAWKIKGRLNEGKFSEINHTGGRMTLKMLIDGYFQWIAFDSDKKTFSGTGGGAYTFENGIYEESILFFSRDNSRVGATLNFNGKVRNKEWEHTGKTSAGKPLHEVWVKVKK